MGNRAGNPGGPWISFPTPCDLQSPPEAEYLSSGWKELWGPERVRPGGSRDTGDTGDHEGSGDRGTLGQWDTGDMGTLGALRQGDIGAVGYWGHEGSGDTGDTGAVGYWGHWVPWGHQGNAQLHTRWRSPAGSREGGPSPAQTTHLPVVIKTTSRGRPFHQPLHAQSGFLAGRGPLRGGLCARGWYPGATGEASLSWSGPGRASPARPWAFRERSRLQKHSWNLGPTHLLIHRPNSLGGTPGPGLGGGLSGREGQFPSSPHLD